MPLSQVIKVASMSLNAICDENFRICSIYYQVNLVKTGHGSEMPIASFAPLH